MVALPESEATKDALLSGEAALPRHEEWMFATGLTSAGTMPEPAGTRLWSCGRATVNGLQDFTRR